MNEMLNIHTQTTFLPGENSLGKHPHGLAAGAAYCLSLFRKDRTELDPQHESTASDFWADSYPSESAGLNGRRLSTVGLDEVTDDSDCIPNLLALSVANAHEILLMGTSSGSAIGRTEEIVATSENIDGRGQATAQGYAAMDAGLIDKINESHAQIVVFGINVPIQQGWIARHRHKFKFVRIIVAKGAIIDFSAGSSLGGNHAAKFGRLFHAS